MGSILWWKVRNSTRKRHLVASLDEFNGRQVLRNLTPSPSLRQVWGRLKRVEAPHNPAQLVADGHGYPRLVQAHKDRVSLSYLRETGQHDLST